ncbi:serine/threonine protein kinase [Actinomadura graeca]|uniref:Serine/threonine protein kinase n=1 Tax=Actinomadura graeca TaxID=2750812 RepID=A0ABX8QUM9_9ACTN|nr:serine/threonine-protein kinase [Actinomadura graeca]QXJ21919.1 serine/threonine protein kinase [Actinomadura graeca]
MTVEPLRPEDPSEIGGYPVLARLGAGGMGQVYLGLTGSGRHIALKVIREDFEGPTALARFRREVETAERVRSRFAAAMVGAGLGAPPYWLATEYVPGPTLRQAVAEHGPLPPGTCLRLLAALATGLLEIHRQGVQHRDLKPGNVILAPDGPRLIDFGIARGEGQTQITRTGAWNGTPGYVAPEVVREQEPLPASDVFSLAGTIAYAATGRPPFGGGRIEAILHRTLSGEIDLDGVDPGLAEIVALCAAKDPAGRPTPERLLQLTAAHGALTGDADYRRVVGVAPPVPAGVPEAIASGLVPAGRAGAGARRSALLAAAGVVAVVLLGSLGARALLDGDGGAKGGPGRTNGTTGTPGAASNPSGGLKSAGGQGSAGPSGTPRGQASGPPPDVILVKQPTDDFAQVHWSKTDANCLPAVRPEDTKLAADVQTSSPRVPYTKSTVDLGMRFKYARPSGYYLAAEVRPPGDQQGNGVTGIVRSRPRPYPAGDGWLTLRYPDDFDWDGSGSAAYPLVKGDWTVIWMHVRANGDAFYMGCDGFTVG